MWFHQLAAFLSSGETGEEWAKMDEMQKAAHYPLEEESDVKLRFMMPDFKEI